VLPPPPQPVSAAKSNAPIEARIRRAFIVGASFGLRARTAASPRCPQEAMLSTESPRGRNTPSVISPRPSPPSGLLDAEPATVVVLSIRDLALLGFQQSFDRLIRLDIVDARHGHGVVPRDEAMRRAAVGQRVSCGFDGASQRSTPRRAPLRLRSQKRPRNHRSSNAHRRRPSRSARSAERRHPGGHCDR
jgi:hypothetical protein